MLLLLSLLFFQTPAISFDLPLVASVAAFIVGPLKVIVDIIKGSWTSLPGKAIPVVGVVVGYVLAIALMIATKTALESAVYAQLLFAALAAQGGAMVLTGAQNRANEKRQEAAGTNFQ